MRYRVLIAAATALLGAACGGGTDLERESGVAVSFATQSPTASGAAPAYAVTAALLGDTITSGSDTLIITSVEIVMREIELERLEAPSCDVEPKPEGCEDVELGPVLVDLPLSPGAQQRFTVQVPPGTYTEIEFEIHKVSSDDPDDAVFIQENPDFVDKSIRVQGTFNGQSFTYETDLNVEQELEFTPALVLQESGSTNVTILVDLAAWFRSDSGGLIDPATANKGGPNENVVRDNIIASMEAFEDRDGDGDKSDES
jgi:hypothetical protein